MDFSHSLAASATSRRAALSSFSASLMAAYSRTRSEGYSESPSFFSFLPSSAMMPAFSWRRSCCQRISSRSASALSYMV